MRSVSKAIAEALLNIP